MHRRYTHDELHHALYERVGGIAPPAQQVYACPYFVRLKGILEPDWGVCVNPESPGLGLVFFEHDTCGGLCPYGRQRTNEWLARQAALFGEGE